MIEITPASLQDIPVIRHLAHATWPAAFGSILSKEQIDYMLDAMYSEASLTGQMDKGHRFLLAMSNGQCVGYASYESVYKGEAVTKIHKLYVLPSSQGEGIGKQLINTITQLALEQGNTLLSLNVNRYNPAVQFYEHNGFVKTKEENIEIGLGYLMEDYVMEKIIRPQ